MMERRCSCLVVTSGNPAREVEAHLIAEYAQGAGAGAVFLAAPVMRVCGAENRDIAAPGSPYALAALRLPLGWRAGRRRSS